MWKEVKYNNGSCQPLRNSPHLQSHDLIFTAVHKCNTVQYISVFVHVQHQSSDHGLLSASFLLTADEQRAGQPSTTSTSTNFPVSRKERERKRQRQERGQEQEGEQVNTVDGCCPDRGDSTFFTDEEKKDFKIESKDRNSPSGRSHFVTLCTVRFSTFVSVKRKLLTQQKYLWR